MTHKPDAAVVYAVLGPAFWKFTRQEASERANALIHPAFQDFVLLESDGGAFFLSLGSGGDFCSACSTRNGSAGGSKKIRLHVKPHNDHIIRPDPRFWNFARGGWHRRC
jgi:hypothetical protein